MENKPAQNIQDTFLNTVRKDKTPITIYLVSGVKLTGKIRSFDKYSVLLENNSQEQLIFKHAISTVVSNRSVMHSEHRPAAMHTGLGPAAVAAHRPPHHRGAATARGERFRLEVEPGRSSASGWPLKQRPNAPILVGVDLASPLAYQPCRSGRVRGRLLRVDGLIGRV